MRIQKLSRSIGRVAALAAMTWLYGFSGMTQARTVDLGSTPPDLTASVPPNLVVTFDDSGSMGFDYMGDRQPFNNAGWQSPYRCAGVIDPNATSGLGTHVMNGVYYNPKLTYSPPAKADGTSFPNADSSLTDVWNDGVSANRPRSASGSTNTTNFNDYTYYDRRGNLRTHVWTCSGDRSNPVSGDGPYYYRYTGPALTTDAFGLPDATSLSNLYSSGNWTAVAVPSSQYQNWANWWAYYHTRNLMARTSLSRVFANNSDRTSDGGYGSALRVAWQNINNSTYKLPGSAIISSLIDTPDCGGSSGADPANIQQSGTVKAPPDCFRSAFYNWMFQVGAGGGTPTRSATDRAGTFFTRGNGNTDATGDLTDPYWQPSTTGGTGHELYCRQNYHVLITDGLWNGGSDGPTTSSLTLADSDPTLPDNVEFPVPTNGNVTSIYKPVHDSGDSGYASISDVAFHYWANDLRSDLYDPTNGKIVSPYLPDKTTSLFNLSGTTGSTVAATNINPEIYFNPANDPATWPHMDEFMIGLGVDGTLLYSNDLDCSAGSSDNSDACLLRTGKTNSTGSAGWPTPNGSGSGITENIDDTWHAALAGRGQFFSARSPDDLVNQLSKILNNIQARSSTTAGLAVSISTASTSTAGFSGGYNSGDWSGNLPKLSIDPATGQPNTATPLFDAGCILTGSDPQTPCPTTGSTNVTQAVAPTDRNVYTYGSSASTTQTFKTLTTLSAQEQCALNKGTWSGSTSTCTGGDGYGQARIDYLRGSRSNEATGATPQFRARGSLLGAIVDAEPAYVGSPSGGFLDNWPTGAPEAASGAQLYSSFVSSVNGRQPMIYAASNDGMLHAFNATTGAESWAYVPKTVIENGAVTKYTDATGGFVPTVDGGITTQDVYFPDTQSWHTILVGALRLGGRGVYALDITNADATPTVLWEFNNASSGGADLGYTYATPNIARLNYDDGTNAGKWVVLLSSGYMPVGSDSADPATTTESLFVLDAETGTVIRELKTSNTDSTAYGLSTPAVWDYGPNQVDDIATAGDLMGNLWRFDLADASASNWSIDKMFQTPQPSPVTYPAPQPITVKPVSLSDPINGGAPIWIFGTGKYLSNSDNTSLNVPSQWFYGIRDYGTGSTKYPISASSLITQTLSESSGGIRALTMLSAINSSNQVAPGWKFQMADAGERDVVPGEPLYNAGDVILTTLIPKGDDPCAPGRGGAIMLIDSSTGGATGTPPVSATGYTPPNGSGIVGETVTNPPAAGTLPVLSTLGGGQLVIPGMPQFNIKDSFWHRRSWRTLLNVL